MGEVGLQVVEDEEVEEEEEDMEVAQIFNDAKAKHRKIMTGIYTMLFMSERSEIYCMNVMH